MARRAGTASIAGVIALLVFEALQAQSERPPVLRGMLVRAGAYVERFEREFALVIGEEEYQQRIGRDPTRFQPQDEVRQTHSEVVFLWIPDERLWLAARNVLVLDGKPVPDSAGQVGRALAEPRERLARLRGLRNDSTRYNLGDIFRNFNDPVFTLQFLSARLQSRFAWVLEAREVLEKRDAWRIRFAERVRPTVIVRDRIDLPATGHVWIDAESGIVHKTRLEVIDSERRTRARIEVSFRPDETIEVWVPSRMEEAYSQDLTREVFRQERLQPMRVVGDQIIRATATYSNFRRFETSGRLVIP